MGSSNGRERSSGKAGEGEAGEQFAVVADAEDLEEQEGRCMGWAVEAPLAW